MERRVVRACCINVLTLNVVYNRSPACHIKSLTMVKIPINNGPDAKIGGVVENRTN